MTTPPSLTAFTFRPIQADALTITAVGALTPEQVAKLAAAFKVGEKAKAIASLKDFVVTANLDDVMLEPPYRLTCWLWVIGKASQYAALSYNPTPPKYIKAGLWRLRAGESLDSASVAVSLPAPAKIARLTVVCQGLYTPPAIYQTP